MSEIEEKGGPVTHYRIPDIYVALDMSKIKEYKVIIDVRIGKRNTIIEVHIHKDTENKRFFTIKKSCKKCYPLLYDDCWICIWAIPEDEKAHDHILVGMKHILIEKEEDKDKEREREREDNNKND